MHRWILQAIIVVDDETAAASNKAQQPGDNNVAAAFFKRRKRALCGKSSRVVVVVESIYPVSLVFFKKKLPFDLSLVVVVGRTHCLWLTLFVVVVVVVVVYNQIGRTTWCQCRNSSWNNGCRF
jgi:hypothetical protein